MSSGERLDVRQGMMLALRMLGVGVILGPAAFGTVITLKIYASAVAAGENPVSRLMLFPFGWFMAIMFAGMPAAILTAVLIGYRMVVGPWTKRRLAAILFPLTWALAVFVTWQMNGAPALDMEVAGVAAVGGLYCAVLIFAIILLFWSLRHRLGLSALGPTGLVADKKVGTE